MTDWTSPQGNPGNLGGVFLPTGASLWGFGFNIVATTPASYTWVFYPSSITAQTKVAPALFEALDAGGVLHTSVGSIPGGSLTTYAGPQTNAFNSNLALEDYAAQLRAQGFNTRTQVPFVGGVEVPYEVPFARGTRVVDVDAYKWSIFGGERNLAEVKTGNISLTARVGGQVAADTAMMEGAAELIKGGSGLGYLGAGAFGIGLGFAGWNQYQAYVADGYQFGSQSLHTGIENGVTIGGPFVIGGGLWLAGAATFAAGTGIGGVAIGIGYLGYKLSQVPPYQPWPGDPVPDDVGTAIPVPAPAFPSVPFQNMAPASANLSPNPTALSPVVYNWMLNGGDQLAPAPVAPVVSTFDSAPPVYNWTLGGGQPAPVAPVVPTFDAAPIA